MRRSSWEKAVHHLFRLPTISSTSAVCSARASDCFLNIEKVRRAIKFATNSDSGVSSTTTSVIPAIDRQHENQRAENGDHAGEQLGKAHQQAVGELIDIRNDAADHIAVGVAVDVFQRQHAADLGERP